MEKMKKIEGKRNVFLLFSFQNNIERIKIEGKTHDWKISKTIRESIKKPLILAGGLNKDNVKKAIEVVKPYAIDVSSSLESEKGKKDFKKVKNKELWQEYLNVAKNHKIKATWVRGHSGHKMNEMCDRLAVNEAKKFKETA